jgi:hypothetical protein
MVLLINLLLVWSAISANAQTTSRPSVELDGQAAQVIVDLGGGSIARLRKCQLMIGPLRF